ncbi:RNA-binding domain-containing protein [Lipomyces arxii]|uniref:RNA-binding domain-containing protein n=1 Tax=Lipomyces arxii TaxID=56418 RepID=UPI0034CED5BF
MDDDRSYYSAGGYNRRSSRDSYRQTRDRSRSPGVRRYNSRSPSPNGYGRARSPPQRFGGGDSYRGGSGEYDSVSSNEFSGALSGQERRVYVGNLPYTMKRQGLTEFMQSAGRVVSATVLELPNGTSKGCGIVEFDTKQDAQHAIETLSGQDIDGRVIYVREDREALPHSRGGPRGNYGGRVGRDGGSDRYRGRGDYNRGYDRGGFDHSRSSRGGYSSFNNGPAQYGEFAGPAEGGGSGSRSGNQLFVGNLPFSVGWQDLKDFFRQAGNVVRADVFMGSDGRSRGRGTVSFETAEEARNAIQQLNGVELQGRPLDVREDRMSNGGDNYDSGYASRSSYGTPRGGFGFRGGFHGGFAGGRGAYSGSSGYDRPPVPQQPPNDFTDGATSGGVPSNTIHVRNLPWSTSNEDLVDLFQTIGKVERAEIQYTLDGRAKGSGVVQLENKELAQTAIDKFNGYSYGNRPLSLSFVRYENSMDSDMGISSTTIELTRGE